MRKTMSKNTTWLLLAVVAVGIAAVVWFCRSAPLRTVQPTHIVLISIATCRADRRAVAMDGAARLSLARRSWLPMYLPTAPTQRPAAASGRGSLLQGEWEPVPPSADGSAGWVGATSLPVVRSPTLPFRSRFTPATRRN